MKSVRKYPKLKKRIFIIQIAVPVSWHSFFSGKRKPMMGLNILGLIPTFSQWKTPGGSVRIINDGVLKSDLNTYAKYCAVKLGIISRTPGAWEVWNYGGKANPYSRRLTEGCCWPILWYIYLIYIRARMGRGDQIRECWFTTSQVRKNLKRYACENFEVFAVAESFLKSSQYLSYSFGAIFAITEWCALRFTSYSH